MPADRGGQGGLRQAAHLLGDEVAPSQSSSSRNMTRSVAASDSARFRAAHTPTLTGFRTRVTSSSGGWYGSRLASSTTITRSTSCVWARIDASARSASAALSWVVRTTVTVVTCKPPPAIVASGAGHVLHCRQHCRPSGVANVARIARSASYVGWGDGGRTIHGSAHDEDAGGGRRPRAPSRPRRRGADLPPGRWRVGHRGRPAGPGVRRADGLAGRVGSGGVARRRGGPAAGRRRRRPGRAAWRTTTSPSPTPTTPRSS